MDKPLFVYVTYIAAAPEDVWKAIIDPKIAAKYWQHVNLSDWKVGSKWDHRADSKDGHLHLTGKVLEVSPYSRLVITWAFPEEVSDESKHSKVTFSIEPVGKAVRLTMTYENLEAGSRMLKDITQGWPEVLSSMKSYLELGQVRLVQLPLLRTKAIYLLLFAMASILRDCTVPNRA